MNSHIQFCVGVSSVMCFHNCLCRFLSKKRKYPSQANVRVSFYSHLGIYMLCNSPVLYMWPINILY